MGEEWLSEVDEQDVVIGRRRRDEIHRLGLRHRSVHILVFNPGGELFLQRRSLSKDIHPGLWDTSAAGHVDAGEAYERTAWRELGEELGIGASIGVVVLFVVFMLCGLRISGRATDAGGRLMAFGITLLISLQAAINIGVVTGRLPTKGLPLPFISFGGTSLVMLLFMVGVLLNIAKQGGSRSKPRP